MSVQGTPREFGTSQSLHENFFEAPLLVYSFELHRITCL